VVSLNDPVFDHQPGIEFVVQKVASSTNRGYPLLRWKLLATMFALNRQHRTRMSDCGVAPSVIITTIAWVSDCSGMVLIDLP
jgi:hypothetical protein